MTNSALINDILNKRFDEEIQSETIRMLEDGIQFIVFESKGRPDKKMFCIQLNLFRIAYVVNKHQIEGVINLRDLKEVRIGNHSKLFDSIENKDKCFTLFFGKKFRLKELYGFAYTPDVLQLWRNGIQYLQRKLFRAPYHSLIDIMLRREFTEIKKIRIHFLPLNNFTVVLKDMKTFLSKIQCKLTNEQLKEQFYDVDRAISHQLDFEGFSTFYMNLLNSESNRFFSQNIGQYSSDGKRVTLKEFIDFLTNEQKVNSPDETQVSNLIKDYLLDPLRHYEIDPYFTITEFIDYLYSKDNSVWNFTYESVYQDMDQPLCHYFIATSHNTYLSGDQFKSESSVECYTRSLRMGCRCIELDCWDGPDGKPLIYHGRTLTSKIRFIDVITTIKEHAFIASEFPLILSIENHCSLKQQQYMAEAFVKVFGDLLLRQQIDLNEQSLPSPNQLKYKIILKHKKLTRPFEEKTVNSPKPEEVHDSDLDLSDSLKNGILFLEDPVEKKWKSHYFVLTREKLYYVEPNPEAEEEDDDEDNLYGTRDSLQYYQDNAYELHYGETWFHGRLRGGRAEAELLLQRYLCSGNCSCKAVPNMCCSDGTFLVRESEANFGHYSLSFIYQNQSHHSRINVERGTNGHNRYCLNESVSFNSLYELITHYQTHPLRSQLFRQLYLTTPVPQPNSHEDKVWFNKNMTRSEAEDRLRRLRNDGAFLVRPSERSSSHDENLFAISFRAENKIKHCRIRREGRLFVIGSAEFESLTELIDYYEKNPLYRKVKLKFPATEESVRIIGGEPDLNSQCNYTNPKSVSIKVKACYDYRGNNEEELSFNAGDIITNVVKQDSGWWKGDLADRIGRYFPSNFVEEIEEEEIRSAFDSNKISLDLNHGSIELDSDNLVLIPFVPNRSHDWVFRLGNLDIGTQSEEELKEWVSKIQEAIQMNKNKLRNSKELKQNLKIAPELDELIVYCTAVPYNGHWTHFTEMSSFHELKMEKLINPMTFRNILRYNEKQLSRVYPKGSRLDSSNYDPIRMWNCGVQLVALNYQTPDKPMQLNEAMFLQNGKCGYVLKPKYMFEDNYNPYEKPSEISNFEPIDITVRVIGARHLKKSLKGIVSPSIEIEIIGVEYDCKKCLTRVINDNGLNPFWSKETFVFNIICPELAFIRFLVSHLDTFDDSSFVGQSILPISCLRKGYRSVQLANEYSEELELSTLLIHIDIRQSKQNNINYIAHKTSIEMLKNNSKHLHKMIDESKSSGNLEEVKRLENVLLKVEEALKSKTEEKDRFVTVEFENKSDVKIISELSINKKYHRNKNNH